MGPVAQDPPCSQMLHKFNYTEECFSQTPQCWLRHAISSTVYYKNSHTFMGLKLAYIQGFIISTLSLTVPLHYLWSLRETWGLPHLLFFPLWLVRFPKQNTEMGWEDTCKQIFSQMHKLSGVRNAILTAAWTLLQMHIHRLYALFAVGRTNNSPRPPGTLCASGTPLPGYLNYQKLQILAYIS